MEKENSKSSQKINGKVSENKKLSKKLKIWFSNVDVLTSDKMNELKIKVNENNDVDILMLSEIKPKNYNRTLTISEYKLEAYNFETLNILSPDVGRGMGIYFRKTLDYNLLDINTLVEENPEEVMLFELTHLKNKYIVVFIYRSPSSCCDNNRKLNFLLKKISQLEKYAKKIIVGDFNFRDINWENWTYNSDNHCINSEFIECLRDCYFTQLVDKPTRGRGSDTPSTLDLIITDDPDIIENVNVMSPLGRSDHSVISLEVPYDTNKAPKQTYRDYSKADYTIMKNIFSNDLLEEIQGAADNVEIQWKLFTDACNEAHKYVPEKIAKQNKQFNVKLDEKGLAKMRKKHRLWQRYLQTRDGKIYLEYRRCSNQLRNITRKAVKNYEKELAKEVKKNPKRFWKYVNMKRKHHDPVPSLYQDDKEDPTNMTNDDLEKAELLNKFFASNFTKPDNTLWDLPNKNPPTHPIEIEISEGAVRELLDELVVHKSPGPDCIKGYILKNLSKEIAPILVEIFKTSLHSNTQPESWKEANITPIHKKGSKCSRRNYRPISLTSIVCKMLETIIKMTLIKYMVDNRYLSDKQFGFLPGRSTVLQLLKVLDQWTEILDSGGEVDVVYCDFQKAFDQVSHSRLIQVLKNYHIDESLISWIDAFLSNRKQRVSLNGVCSSWVQVLSGVPQGSVLGPVLFVIFINSLVDKIHGSELFMYADDVKAFKSIITNEDISILQNDLDRMHQWSCGSLLKFHLNGLPDDKCVFMNICSGRKNDCLREYTLNDIKLRTVRTEKDLGVIIDNNLKFDSHISAAVNKGNQMMGLIRRTMTYMDKEIFRLLFKTLVRPHLEYAVAAWNPHLCEHRISIENVQRRATKLIPGFKHISYNDRLRTLKLPTLYFRRYRGDMIETYKIVTRKYDIDPESLFIFNKDPTRGHPYKLYKRHSNRDVRKYFFSQRVVNQWNSLSTFVVTAQTVNEFKNRFDKFWSTREEIMYNQDFPIIL